MTALCLDIKDAAASVGLSTSVLRAYIDSGLLPTIRMPSTKYQNMPSRRILVSVDDLRAFVEKHRVTEPAR